MAVLFLSLLVVYMLINWLPMLLIGQGFRAGQAAGVMFVCNWEPPAARCCWALLDKLSPALMSLLIIAVCWRRCWR